MGDTRKPRRWTVAVRILVITALVTLVSFAVALLAGITGFAVLSLLRGGAVNMANAYRHVAAPVAAVALVIALVLATRNEVREYRLARAAYQQQSRVA